MSQEKLNKLSIPLGLLGYINPILFAITIITIIRNIGYKMIYPFNHYLFYGVIISALFGFIISTAKVLAGLGLIKSAMPAAFVLGANIGIMISGLTLIHYALKMSVQTLLILTAVILAVLILIYLITRKLSTVALFTGAIGFLLVNISLIIISLWKDMIVSVILYGVAISLSIALCVIGIRSDLRNSKVLLVIEILNVLCQLLVCISTFILFSR